MKLTYKFFILVSIATIITGILLAYFSFTLVKNSVEQSITSQQMQLAQQTMDKIDRVLHERYTDIRAISGDESIENFLLDNLGKKFSAGNSPAYPVDFVSRVDELLKVTGPWDDIDIVGMDGTILYSNDKTAIGKNITEEPQSLPFFNTAVSGTVSYSDAILDKETKIPTMFFATPIIEDTITTKPVVGVVIAHLQWEVIAEIVHSINGPIVDLYDKNGLEMANNDDPLAVFKENNSSHQNVKDVLEGKEKSEVTLSVDNIQTVSSSVMEKGFLDYSGNNWVLLIEQPTSIAFAPALDAAKKIILVIIPIILAINGAVFLFIYSFLKPIKRLKSISKSLAQGDFSKRAEHLSKDEIGELGESFNIMASNLQELYTNLEGKVREKTSELEKEKTSVEQKVLERTRELSDERTKLHASINSISIGYILTGVNNEVLLINTAAEDILTLATKSAQPAQQAIDSSWLKGKIDMNYIQLTLREHIDLLTQIEESKRKKSSLIFKNIPYKKLYINIFITPVVNEDSKDAIGSVVLLEDITEQKIAERSRDEFFSIASHELRTPLTAIRGNTALIQEYYMPQINNSEVGEMISDIHESSLRLINIVNDFLDLSRLEQGKIQYTSEAFEIQKLTEEVIKEYDVTGSRKKLALQIESPTDEIPLVFADKNRIRQILVNLLSNGIKFTDEGGVTFIFKKLDHHVKVLIKDTGKGISEENKILLFRKFQQAESNILTRETAKGTGLGLYISKMMMNAMGGDVVLEESKIGVGSTFSVTIPIATEDEKLNYKNGQKPDAVGEQRKDVHV